MTPPRVCGARSARCLSLFVGPSLSPSLPPSLPTTPARHGHSRQAKLLELAAMLADFHDARIGDLAAEPASGGRRRASERKRDKHASSSMKATGERGARATRGARRRGCGSRSALCVSRSVSLLAVGAVSLFLSVSVSRYT